MCIKLPTDDAARNALIFFTKTGIGVVPALNSCRTASSLRAHFIFQADGRNTGFIERAGQVVSLVRRAAAVAVVNQRKLCAAKDLLDRLQAMGLVDNLTVRLATHGESVRLLCQNASKPVRPSADFALAAMIADNPLCASMIRIVFGHPSKR